MKTTLIFLLLVVSLGMLSAGMAWDWAVQTNCSSIAVNGMVIDKYDNVYLATSYYADFNYNDTVLTPVDEDILILKYDSTGKLLWALPAGGKYGDRALAIAISPAGGIYVAGDFITAADFGKLKIQSTDETNHDIFVAKVSEAGAWEWVNPYGSPNEETVFSLAVDSKNNIYLAGSFSEELSMGKSNLSSYHEVPAFFLARLKGQGDVDWAVPIKLVSYGYINKLVLNNKEQPVIAGNFDIEADVDTEIIMMSNGDWDGFVCQYDQNGAALWAKYFGGSDTDSVNDMICDKAGNLYITGNFNNTITLDKELISVGDADIMVAKLSPQGKWLWSASCGGEYGDYSVALTLKPDGNVLVGGNFYESMSMLDREIVDEGEGGLFIAEADKNGSWLSLLSAAGDGSESTRNMVTDSNGNVIVIGEYDYTLNIGSAELVTEGNGYADKTLFLTKLKTVK